MDASLELSFWGTANTALKTNYASNTEAKEELNRLEEEEEEQDWEIPENEVGWLVGKGVLHQSPEDGNYLFVPTQEPAWNSVPRGDKDKVQGYSPVVDFCAAWPALGLDEQHKRLSYGVGSYSVYLAS